MKPTISRSLATKLLLGTATLLLFAPFSVDARTRPQYGGRAIVQLNEPAFELDPASTQLSPEMRNQILPLIFETLTSLDERGKPQPLLASGFIRVHSTRWSFTIRKDLRFADGSPLVANGLADQLAKLLPSAKVRMQSDGQLIIDTPSPWENLPAILSLPRYSIYKQYEDGTVAGTGPYAVSQFESGRTLMLGRNATYWGPAPYFDRIEIRFTDLTRTNPSGMVIGRLISADLAELNLEQARNVTPTSSVRTGDPTQLYVLVWSPKNTVDERLRNAMPQLIARDSLAATFSRDGVTPAYSYLPQPVSGYAFLFQNSPDVASARPLITDSGRKTPVTLVYSATDPVARQLAERISVNARDAGLTVQPYGDRSPQTALTGSANAAILKVPVISDSPAVALFALAADLQMNVLPIIAAVDTEHLLDAERGLLNDTHVVPLAFAPSASWLSPRLHDVRNGPEWELDSAWDGGAR